MLFYISFQQHPHSFSNDANRFCQEQLLPRQSSSFVGLTHASRAGLWFPDNVGTVILSTHHLQFETRNVFRPRPVHQYDAVLLQIVANAGDIGRSLLAIGEPYKHAFAVGRIWLLGLLDKRLDDHAFHEGLAVQRVPPFLLGRRNAPSVNFFQDRVVDEAVASRRPSEFYEIQMTHRLHRWKACPMELSRCGDRRVR